MALRRGDFNMEDSNYARAQFYPGSSRICLTADMSGSDLVKLGVYAAEMPQGCRHLRVAYVKDTEAAEQKLIEQPPVPLRQ
jgi:hypothetical protein